MLDILIRGGSYPDFEANVLVKGDIGIKDGKIAETGVVTDSAERVIDADGCIVSPGFIDIHMHEEDFSGEGQRYIIAEMMLRMGVTTCLGGNCGLQKQSTAQFRDVISALGGAPVNYLLAAGYNTARTKRGLGRRDSASPQLISQLAAEIQQELQDGACGISFGLEYDPGISFAEVVTVLNAQPQKELFVSMHYREDATGACQAVQEMIDIAEATGTRFQISHLSSCSAMGQMAGVLKKINEAIEKNPLLSYDTYPYNAFSTHIGSEVFSDGCFDRWEKDYSALMLTDGAYKNQFCTKELFEKVREAHPEMLAVAFVMNEDEIAAAISNPYGMIASDGIINHGNGHPRAAGTFPRILGKYVREDKVLSMMDALRKMTLLPAQRLALSSKGQVLRGMDADITIFDPAIVRDGATFEDIHIRPAGIRHVLIAGKAAVTDEEIVNGRLGQFIPSHF